MTGRDNIRIIGHLYDKGGCGGAMWGGFIKQARGQDDTPVDAGPHFDNHDKHWAGVIDGIACTWAV
jgi:hypothetical protein